MSPEYDDAYESGIAHGWNAANFEDAYGARDRSADTRPGWVKSTDQISGYDTGWHDGYDRYFDDLWQDGSPREDDE